MGSGSLSPKTSDCRGKRNGVKAKNKIVDNLTQIQWSILFIIFRSAASRTRLAIILSKIRTLFLMNVRTVILTQVDIEHSLSNKMRISLNKGLNSTQRWYIWF